MTTDSTGATSTGATGRLPAPVRTGVSTLHAEEAQLDAASTMAASRKTFDELYVRHPRRWLYLFVFAYLCVATAFALRTPLWQSPDEPAHFNYIAHIAEGHGLPVLQMGDYNQYYRDKIVGSQFDPALSIEPLRYESYQPPLYYLTAAPIYWLSSGLSQENQLRALRLYSVLLGVVALVLLYRCALLIFPNRALIPLGAMGFAGLIPMHVAMTAAVNNDGLAELLLLASTLLLLHWVGDEHRSRTRASANEPALTLAWRRLGLLGLILGLGLLTKIYAYLLFPVFILAVLWTAWVTRKSDTPGEHVMKQERKRDRIRYGVGSAFCVALPALLLGLPMWLRNMYLYGWNDPLALNWHDRVVVGQPQTLAWIEKNGWFPYGERAVTFTFKSFWGVFGWMGVFLDNRIYFALMVFSGLLIMGLLWASVRLITNSSSAVESVGLLTNFQRRALWLLGFILLAVLAGYVVYNIKFVQHQGRYLFWGMLPISVLMATAWRELLQPPQGTATGVLVGTLTLALGFLHMLDVHSDMWTLGTLGCMTLFLLMQPLLLLNLYSTPQPGLMAEGEQDEKGRESRVISVWGSVIRTVGRFLNRLHILALLRTMCWLLPFALLFLLNVGSLFRAIIPNLKLP